MSDANIYNAFVQNLSQSNPLTQLGAGVSQIVQQREAARIRQAQENGYRQALMAYMNTSSAENWMALANAAEPLGKIDFITGAVENMTEIQQQADADMYGQILGSIDSGNINLAHELISQNIAAYTNAGDEQNASYWRQALQGLDAQQFDETAKFLGVRAGATEAGRQMLDNRIALNQEQRADQGFIRDSVIQAVETFIADEGRRGEILSIIDESNLAHPEFAKELVNLFSVLQEAGEEGLTGDELLRAEERIRKEYQDNTAANRAVIEAFESIEGLVNLDDPTGMSDQGIITMYALLLDPGSTVREGEAGRIASSIGLFDRVDAWAQSLGNGVVVNDNARQAVIEAAQNLRDFALTRQDGWRDLAMQTVEYIDPTGAEGSAERVFRQLELDRDAQGRIEQTPPTSLIDRERALVTDFLNRALQNPNITETESAQIRGMLSEVPNMDSERIANILSSGAYEEQLQQLRGQEQVLLPPGVPSDATQVPFEAVEPFHEFLRQRVPNVNTDVNFQRLIDQYRALWAEWYPTFETGGSMDIGPQPSGGGSW